MWNYFIIFNFFVFLVNGNGKVKYNTYTRLPATCSEEAKYEAEGNAETCLVSFKPCDENEWRRYDGSCNNLKYPSHGTYNTPEWRMVPPTYGEGYTPAKMIDGEEFPLARSIRTQILSVGGGVDRKFTQAASYFIEYSSADIMTIHDIEKYVLKTTYCCKPEGLKDPICKPNYVSIEDDMHRFAGQTCINMTIPLTFQNMGCAPTDTVPSRINRATPHWDQTTVYYFNGSETGAHNRRAYKGGKLKTETVNGITLASDAHEKTTCFIKQAKETGCLRDVANTIAGTNFFSTMFTRMHNYIADCLASYNPHWTDNILFHIAMDINIAFYNQILLYELYTELLGKENMIKEGIITRHDGFRDSYDENIPPGISTEFSYALRWFHMTQEGLQELFDMEHNYMRSFPMVNYTLSVHELAYDDHMVGLTHGLFLQPAGTFDDAVVDVDMTSVGLGPFQHFLDILTNDLARGKHYGIHSYPAYRDFCTGYTKEHKTFDDLRYIISDTNLYRLRKIYKHVKNVDFYAGVWSETFTPGTSVPPTIRCILMAQLKRTVVTDRHWYERPNRPYAFNRAQLKQIRKASLASLMCTVGDQVLRIQPKAFLRHGPGNEIVSCDKIPKLDLSVWKEDA